MATVRAGRKPFDSEIELMRETRAKLASVARGAIGTVIEDLELHSKLKDQSLGFRTPKMSIVERYSHAKWKMEETKKFTAPSTTHPSQANDFLLANRACS